MLTITLTTYLALNALVLFAWAILGIASRSLQITGRPLSASSLLRLHYFALPLILACTIATPLIPGSNSFRPAAQVWSAPSIKNFNRDYAQADNRGYLSLQAITKIGALETNKLVWISSFIAATLLLTFSFRIFYDLAALLRLRKKSFAVKILRGVNIIAHDDISVPFTYWLPGNLTVVVPTKILGSPADYKIAVAHELQHHRQRDTLWVYGLWLLKTICALNPAAHLWSRWISETQEFACDETLVDRKKVDSQAYARCLVTVAQSAVRQKFTPACATGLIFLTDRNLLRRRIESMYQGRKNKSKSTALALGGFLIIALATTAYATKGLVQDRRITLAQAQAMQVNAQKNTAFPIVVNEPVLKQLNRLLGTAEGRQFMREGLARMKAHQRIVSDKIEEYQAPSELLALPLVESGYENLAQRSGSRNVSAGIWQFIPSTARNFGLRVNDAEDERLNVELETDAALRYLSMNNLRFKDWQLSLMAYNMGENAVQKAIDEAGTRDPWKLIRAGHENDSDYLAGFMAGLIVMKNPQSLE